MTSAVRRARRVPFIPQMESSECGAASLAMVLAYYGHHVPLSEVREACGVSRDGASAYRIVEAARSYGLRADGVGVEVGEIASLPLPAILHWEFNHFVILESWGGPSGTIIDPAIGRRPSTRAELASAFTGVAIVLEPGDDFRARSAGRNSFHRYAVLLRSFLPTLARILGASIALQAAGLAFPVASQLLLDHVIPRDDARWLWAVALGMTGATVIRSTMSWVRSQALETLRLSMDRDLMSGFVGHLFRLPLAFFLQRQTGDLVQRTQAATVVRNLVSNQGVSTVLDGLQIVAYAILMIVYDPRLAAVVVALAVARVAILAALWRTRGQLVTAEQAALGREAAALVEAFSALETTKAAGAEGHVFGRWADRAAERANISLPRQRLELTSGRAMAVLQATATAAVFWMGGHEVFANRLTLGGFTAFVALQSFFLGPLESLLTSFHQLQYTSAQLARIDDVLEAEPEPSGALLVARPSGAITLDDVSFAYGPDSPLALDSVSLDIASGETIAVVGPTGSGKSTLARVLLGIHRPGRGTIRFDGHDYRDLDLSALRRQMGVALQEVFLFDDSVRANICLDHPEATSDDVERAAALACFAGVVDRLGQGYDARIGENGGLLSGGERQRLAVARALVHKPAVLLLDEATSALDGATAHRLYANLDSLRCTRIVVTHRLDTLEWVDRIVVLDKGRVVQIGDYRTLLGEGGTFGAMISSAASGGIEG